MKPRAAKAPKIKRPLGGGHLAFGGGGGVHAFRDPTSMAAPDQAFTAAMSAAPRGGSSAAPPAAPGSSSAPGSG